MSKEEILMIAVIWLLSTYLMIRGREEELQKDNLLTIIIVIFAPVLALFWALNWLWGLIKGR